MASDQQIASLIYTPRDLDSIKEALGKLWLDLWFTLDDLSRTVKELIDDCFATTEMRAVLYRQGPRPARVYVPEGEGPFPLVLWIHGGGWWMGDDLPMWDGIITPLVREVPAVVVSPDYRLAPEHPFPAAVDDCWASLRWSVEHAADWGADPTRVAVMGGSAGGNLAAVMALRARDAGGPALRFQVLIVPSVNMGGAPTESMRLFSDGYGLNGIDAMRDAYLSNEGDRINPWASPLLAPDLAGLPSALIMTAEFDPLRDEGEAYGARLRAAGVAVEVHRFDGTIHGLLGSPSKLAKSMAMSIDALRGALALDTKKESFPSRTH